jgi:hypothetical protein
MLLRLLPPSCKVAALNVPVIEPLAALIAPGVEISPVLLILTLVDFKWSVPDAEDETRTL